MPAGGRRWRVQGFLQQQVAPALNRGTRRAWNRIRRARREDVERAERDLPVAELVDRAAAEAERRDFSFPPPAAAVPEGGAGAQAPDRSA